MVDACAGSGSGSAPHPPGRYNVLANARRFTSDSLAFAFEILERAPVGVTPGVDFGRNAEGYLRFSYRNPLERSMRRLAASGGSCPGADDRPTPA